MDPQPVSANVRGSPFGVNGPFIGSIFTTALGVPMAVKKIMRLSGMVVPFCLCCGDRLHRLETCPKVVSPQDKEIVAELGTKYAASLLGAELAFFSAASSTGGYQSFAEDRWKGKRVTFQSFLAFTRSSYLGHPVSTQSVVGQHASAVQNNYSKPPAKPLAKLPAQPVAKPRPALQPQVRMGGPTAPATAPPSRVVPSMASANTVIPPSASNNEAGFEQRNSRWHGKRRQGKENEQITIGRTNTDEDMEAPDVVDSSSANRATDEVIPTVATPGSIPPAKRKQVQLRSDVITTGASNGLLSSLPRNPLSPITDASLIRLHRQPVVEQRPLPLFYRPENSRDGELHQLTTDDTGAIFFTPSRKLSMTPLVQRPSRSVMIAGSKLTSPLTSSAPVLNSAIPSVGLPSSSSSSSSLSALNGSSASVANPSSTSALDASVSSVSTRSQQPNKSSGHGEQFTLDRYIHLTEPRRAHFWKNATVELKGFISEELFKLPKDHSTRVQAISKGWVSY